MSHPFPAQASRDGVDWGRLVLALGPGERASTATYPTHAFSAFLATAHDGAEPADADAGNFALAPSAAVAAVVASAAPDETFRLRLPACVDAHVSCRRRGAARCDAALRATCPKTCNACRPPAATPPAFSARPPGDL